MRTNRLFKDSIYEQFARIGKAVSSPKRLELWTRPPLPRGADGRCSGQRIGSDRGQCLPAFAGSAGCPSREAEKVGLFVTYRLADDAVCEFFRTMRVLAESRLAEVEQIKRQFLEGKEGMEPVDREALIKRVRKGIVTVLDVRPSEEYQAGHIPGAISIPLKKLGTTLVRTVS